MRRFAWRLVQSMCSKRQGLRIPDGRAVCRAVGRILPMPDGSEAPSRDRELELYEMFRRWRPEKVKRLLAQRQFILLERTRAPLRRGLPPRASRRAGGVAVGGTSRGRRAALVRLAAYPIADGSRRKSQMPRFRTPSSLNHRLPMSWRTTIFLKLSPVRENGLSSCARFSSSGRA